MTNKEVIELYAKWLPEVLVECFNDFYCIGYNDSEKGCNNGILDDSWHHSTKELNEAWLNEPYDSDIFREIDIQRALRLQKDYYL